MWKTRKRGKRILSKEDDETQENSGETDETINLIISEGGKLTQNEYKTRYDKVRKVIYSELWEKNLIWSFKQMV